MSPSLTVSLCSACTSTLTFRVPNYAARVLHVSTSNTLWALLIGLVLFAAACVLTGRYLCDTNVRWGWWGSLISCLCVHGHAQAGASAVLQHSFRIIQQQGSLSGAQSCVPCYCCCCCVVLQVPKIWALLAAVGVCAVAVMPVLAVLQSGFPLGLWLLVPMLLGVAGIIGGLMTTIGPQIYPPAVRTSGYNLGHNL